MRKLLSASSLLLAFACGVEDKSSTNSGAMSAEASSSTLDLASAGVESTTNVNSALSSQVTTSLPDTSSTNVASTHGVTSGTSSQGQVETTSSADELDSDAGVQPEPTSSSSGDETSTDVTDSDGEPLSFATDIFPLWIAERDPVFVYRGMGSYTGCADATVPCHGSSAPGAQLDMADADTAYAQMMDTPSVSGLCAGSQRVMVGEPETSCLIQFYVGRLGKEDLDWVDDAEIELMRRWIRQGALP